MTTFPEISQGEWEACDGAHHHGSGQITGKEPTACALLQRGKTRGKKIGRQGVISKEDLPISEGRKQAWIARRQEIAGAVDEALGRHRSGAKETYSVTDLRAFSVGLELYSRILAALGAGSAAALHLREALERLSCGCHAYLGSEKREHFRRARELAAAVVALFLEAEGEASVPDGATPGQQLSRELEQSMLPGIGGLIWVGKSSSCRSS